MLLFASFSFLLLTLWSIIFLSLSISYGSCSDSSQSSSSIELLMFSIFSVYISNHCMDCLFLSNYTSHSLASHCILLIHHALRCSIVHTFISVSLLLIWYSSVTVCCMVVFHYYSNLMYGSSQTLMVASSNSFIFNLYIPSICLRLYSSLYSIYHLWLCFSRLLYLSLSLLTVGRIIFIIFYISSCS